MNKKFIILFIVAIFFVSIATRLLPHPANFTPITALALFTGTYLAVKTRWALLLPLFAMAISDMIIGIYDWRVMISVYASFTTVALIGMLVAKKKNIGTVVGATLSASLLFFVVTNVAVWGFSGMYPATLQGLLMSLTMALPFFRHAILGDLIYVGLFFGVYEFAMSYAPLLKPAKEKVE